MKKLYLWLDIHGDKHAIVANSLSEAKQILLQNDADFFKLKLTCFITKRSFNRHELIILTKQIATMLKAGLPIVESLTLLADEHPLPQWKWLLNDIKQKIMTGDLLSQVLHNHSSIFPAIYSEVIATGELTGQLDNSFEKLAEQLEKTLMLQKRIKKALRYPIFLLSVSIIVTFVMLLVVLPKFAEVYKSFDAQLPAFTLAVISLSELLQHHFVNLLITISISYILYQKYLKKYYHSQIQKLILTLPILGEIVAIACLTQIFQTLSITQKSGIPLLSGLLAAQKTAYNSHYQASLSIMTHNIEQGSSFSQAISEHTIYPHLCCQLIRVGEESGTLDLMLENLAKYYQQKSEELTDNLSQKIEPLMMSILAVIIGGLVIAMYLPVFQLGNVIQ